MKTIGLIGGMSRESTVTYYQLINEAVKAKLGGLHSAKILLYSVDFAQIEQYQAKGLFRATLKLSFQFHHTQMDGAHAGRFLEQLQSNINGIMSNDK